jgi:hypothetical protein
MLSDALYKPTICASQADVEKRTLKIKYVYKPKFFQFFLLGRWQDDVSMSPWDYESIHVRMVGECNLLDMDKYSVTMTSQSQRIQTWLAWSHMHVSTHIWRGLVMHIYEVKQEMISNWKDIDNLQLFVRKYEVWSVCVEPDFLLPIFMEWSWLPNQSTVVKTRFLRGIACPGGVHKAENGTHRRVSRIFKYLFELG